MRFSALVPGEVNRASATWRGASGKVLNVATAVAHLGLPVRAVTALGGPPAVAMRAEMERMGVVLAAVPTRGETRTCITLLDDATGLTTELVENAAAIERDELAAFVAAFGENAAGAAAVVLSGSLPAGTPVGLYRDLLVGVACPAVLDARGPELLEALSQRPLLVKPNREELAKTFGLALEGETAVFAAMDRLREQGAQWVLITDGGQPALVAGPEERFRLVPPPVAEMVNPIGCGDCLAAGFTAGVVAGLSPLHALQQGFASAADNCRSLFAGRLEPGNVARLARDVAIERVERG